MIDIQSFIVYGICLLLIYALWRIVLRPIYLIKAYPMPGPPRSSWILGNLPEILKEEPQEPLLRWCNTYNTPVICYFVGPTMRIASNDADVTKQVLQDEATFTKNVDDYNFLADITGYSLLTTADVSFHRKQRHLCNGAFKYEYIVNFIPMFATQAKKLILKWEKVAQTEPSHEPLIEVSGDLSALTLDIIGLGGFNCDFDSLFTDNPGSLSNSYNTLMGTFSATVFMLIPGYRKFPTERFRIRTKCQASIKQYVNEIISMRRKNPSSNPDLLGMLLKAKDSETGSSLSDQELHDLCLTFLVAGHETTSMLLTWTLYALAKYPEVAQKCREEIARVIGSDIINKENIGELKYTNNTIQEVLRLFAPVPFIKRYLEKDTVLGGYTVPKGCHIIVAPAVLHRSKKHWKDPEVFNPDRWNSEESHQYWFLPFIEGPRNCIGKKFAMVEAIVLLVTILQHFTFRVSEAHPFKKKQVATLRPHPGITLHVKHSPI